MYAALAVLLALAQPPGAQLAGEPLVGVVVDSLGKGLADVEVLLSSGLPPSGERPLIGGVLWRANEPRPLREMQAVLARCRTDRAGHFRIELPGEIIRSQEPLPVALWAYQPLGRVAARRLPWAVPAPAEQLQLVIGKSAESVFRVLGEGAAPEAGARVQVSAIDGMVVPRELAEKLTTETGRDGSVTIPAFAPAAIRCLRVESAKYGTQLIGTPAVATATASDLRLEPAGRLSVRILDETGKPVAGLKVLAQTFPDGYDLGGTVGQAEGMTDSSGRLEVFAIAAGRLTLVLDLRSRPDLPFRGLPPANQIIEAGQATTVEIRLKRAVRIEGVIRERTTGLPIAGVNPELPDLAVRMGQNAKAVTDANGKFEGYIEGQQPYAFLYTTPKPFFVPSDVPEPLHLLPAGATEFKLPPTELVRGQALRGSVVDETGSAVAGALVRASWGGKEQILQSVAVRTDSSGSFLLDGLDPLADLRLTAESPGRFSGAAQTGRAGPEKKVKLVVSQANTVMLAGRVVDSSGKPVKGALVRIRSQTRHGQGQVWRVDPVSFGEQSSLGLDKHGVAHPFSVGDKDALYTDKDGRFQTPAAVASGLEYEATVTTRESPPNRTAWLKTGGSPTAVFSDVVLERIKSVEGVVHDRDGKTVSGAIVFQSGDGPIRTRTVTDAQGRFRLSGVLAGKAIIFVRKDGFRFHGQAIDTEAGAADLVLIRLDETPRALKTLECAVPHQEELALARRLLAPYLEKVLAAGTDPQKYQTLAVLAQVDPGRTFELIESHGAGKPRDSVDYLRSAVATALLSQSPDEAVTIAESIQSSATRSWCLTDLVDKLPASARKRKTELLAQALLRARSVKQPGERIRLLGRVAERWFELGEKDRAVAIFAEASGIAKEVAPPAYEVPMFAQSLACVDLTAALALVEYAKDLAKRGDRVSRVFIFDRAYGEIAFRVASSDPAAAERVLSLIVDPYRRGGYAVAACLRMAAKDLARSRRLAATIDDPGIRAYALGRMALVLAALDKPTAVGLLEEAFTQLEHHRDDRKGYSSPACVAAVLLQSVEAVDPVRLQESVWRALALRSPLIDERGDGASARSDAELAMNIARYDRTVARDVLARAIDSYRSTGADTFRQGFVAMALAVIDPARVVSLVESLPDEPSLERSLPKNNSRLFAAQILATTGAERWKTTRGHAVSLWTPEGSDL